MITEREKNICDFNYLQTRKQEKIQLEGIKIAF